MKATLLHLIFLAEKYLLMLFKWWDAIVVESVSVLRARLPTFAVVYIVVWQLIIVWLSYRSLWYFVSKQRVATRLDGKPNNRLHEVIARLRCARASACAAAQS